MAESLGTAVLDLTTNDAMLRSGLARGERDTKSSFARMSTGVIKSAAGIATAFGAYKLGKALFVDPINMAGNFQQTLKVLGAVSGATGGDLDKLSKRAIKLGADVKLPATSAQDAADAMLQLAKAGESTGQIMSSVHGVLLLSAAAEISNADAADMVTKAMGAFGLQAKDTNKIVDDFAGAANASQSSIQDVGLAMTQAGAGFKALRVPIGDASTAIALMAKNGITGGMAGAALNVAFTRLANPTKKATETLKDMNVHLFDSNGKFIGVRGAIEQMSPKLDAMSDKQRLATLAILGGTRGMKALSFVLGGGTKDWDKMKAAVERAGQAQQIANAKTAGFKGAMSGLESTLQTLQITLGTRVLPKATEFVRFLEKVAGAKSFSIAIKIVWQGVVNVAEDLKAAIQKALFGGSELQLKTGSLRLGQQKIVVDPGLVAKLQDAVNAMIATTDWSALGARIADGLGKSSAAIEKGMSTAMNAMMTWVSAHQGQIADVGLTIGLTMVSKLLDPSFWIAHWQLIGGIALSAAAVMFPEGRLAKIGVDALGFLLKPFELLGTKLAAMAGDALVAMSARLESSISPLAGRIALWIGQAIGTATSAVVGAMVDLGAKMITGFINKISGLGIIFRTAAFTAIVTVIGSLIGAAVGKAQELASSVATAIKSLPGKLAGLAGDLTGKIVNVLGQVASDARGKAENVAEDIAGGIKTAPAKLAGLAGDLIGKIRGALSEVIGAAITAAESIGRGIAGGIVSGVGNLAGDLAGKLTGAVGGALSAVKSKFGIQSPSKVFADEVGAQVIQGILVGMEREQGKLEASIASLAEKLKTATKAAIPGIVSSFKDWASNAKSAFDSGVSKLTGALDAQLASAKAKIDAWKATLTPAEVRLNTQKAKEQMDSLTGAMNDAWAALSKLPQQQADDMAALLKQQTDTMNGLMKTAQQSKDSALLAGSDFQAGMAAGGANNPIAAQLLYAQKVFDQAQKDYDAGLVSEAEFIASYQQLQNQKLAAQQAIDAASAASSDATDAQKLASSQATQAQSLLDDYNTWQGLVQQQTDANTAISQATTDNNAAILALQNQQHADSASALATYVAAENQVWDNSLQTDANASRAARDKEAGELNTALVARYNRIDTHLKNVRERTDAAYGELERMATKSGGNITDNLAKAMGDAADPNGPLETSLKKIATLIQKYLKTNSPTELGPMRDLDKWMVGFAPAYLKGLDEKMITTRIANMTDPKRLLGSAYAGAADRDRAAMFATQARASVVDSRALASAHQADLDKQRAITLNQTFHETPASADPVAIGAVTSFALKNLRT